MSAKAIFLFVVAVTFISCHRVFAQPQLWEVYSTSSQPFVNVTIERFEADSLHMRFMNQQFALHQDSIAYLLRRNKSKFGLGFLVGAVVGGVAMNQMSQGDGMFSGMARASSIALGVVIGGGLGGAVGLGAGADTKYQIHKLNSENKRKLLSRLSPNVTAEK
ncbi:hypothetical protein FBQ87_11270 [Sphingobacteriales bacterium CHB3]|nr:hypothetical protein [Sphingobacteriales bacterium CHB3]